MPAPRLCVAVGDSLTHAPYPGEYPGGNPGVGLMTPTALPLLFTTSRDFELLDQAASGYDTTEYLATLWTPAMALNPRWALIMLGTNDWQSVTLAQYTANLARMFREARAQDCEPIFIAPPPTFIAAPPPLGYTTRVRRPQNVTDWVNAGLAQADADGVGWINLHDRCADYYDAYPGGVAAAWTAFGNNTWSVGTDFTHWIEAGAVLAAGFIAEKLPEASPSLASYLLSAQPPTSLATVAQLKAFLKLTGSGEDAALQTLLDRVTGRMQAYTGRSLLRRTREAELYSGLGDSWLDLRDRPAAAVIEVRHGDDLISQSEYAIDAENGRLLGAWTRGDLNYTVTWQSGYATLPGELVDACVRQAAWTYRQSALGGNLLGVTSKQHEGGGSTSFVSDAWLPEVIDVLDGYRRLA